MDEYQIIHRTNIKNRVAIDIGAFHGQYTIALSDKLAKLVIAIEPHDDSFKILQRNTIGRLNIQLIKTAIGEQGKRKFYVHCFGGLNSLYEYHSKYYHHDIETKVNEVECVPLDILAKDHDVAFLKIDVEGAESEVLLSAKETILHCRPNIALETHHSGNLFAIETFLKEINYFCYEEIKGNIQYIQKLIPLHHYFLSPEYLNG